MVEFLMCIAEYLIKALFFVAVAGLGAFIGIKMRKASDAKKEAAGNSCGAVFSPVCPVEKSRFPVCGRQIPPTHRLTERQKRSMLDPDIEHSFYIWV